MLYNPSTSQLYLFCGFVLWFIFLFINKIALHYVSNGSLDVTVARMLPYWPGGHGSFLIETELKKIGSQVDPVYTVLRKGFCDVKVVGGFLTISPIEFR